MVIMTKIAAIAGISESPPTVNVNSPGFHHYHESVGSIDPVAAVSLISCHAMPISVFGGVPPVGTEPRVSASRRPVFFLCLGKAAT